MGWLQVQYRVRKLAAVYISVSVKVSQLCPSNLFLLLSPCKESHEGCWSLSQLSNSTQNQRLPSSCQMMPCQLKPNYCSRWCGRILPLGLFSLLVCHVYIHSSTLKGHKVRNRGGGVVVRLGGREEQQFQFYALSTNSKNRWILEQKSI